jgi:cyclic beta-1,2-glucan synthetase
MTDNLRLAREAFDALPAANDGRGQQLALVLEEAEALLKGAQTTEALCPTLRRLTEKAATLAQEVLPAIGGDSTPDLVFWIEALRKTASEHDRDRLQVAQAPALKGRLKAVADTAREMALAMDFGFLLDPERKLLSIGYSLADNGLDPSCYDLLASEARLASLFAVAKGDVATPHWFRLGRGATPLGSGSALISWSGSMFEYLMPSLVMRAPIGSLLEQTNRLVVERQKSYGRSLGVPWGVSESAYSARDIEFTYQYSNFGVPGLGLKRGLSENVVIAPYATGLAAMVDPHAARRNYAHLAEIGACGRFAASRRRRCRHRAQLHGSSPRHDHRCDREHSARR